MNRLRTIGRLCTTLLVAAAATVQPARAQLSWKNHLEASAVRQVVHRDGELFMATNGGLLVYTIGTGDFRQYDNVSGLLSNDLTALLFDDSGNLWVGTRDIGVAKIRFSGDGIVVMQALNEQINGLTSNNVARLIARDDEIIYCGDPGMGTIVNDFPGATFLKRDGLPDDKVNDVLLVGDLVWAATDSGVVVLDRLNILSGVTGAPAQANVIGDDGQYVWVGTNDGVHRFDPADESWTDMGLPTRRVHSFYYDGTSMWAGGSRNLWRYTGSGQVWEINRLETFINSYKLNGTLLENHALTGVPGGDMFIGGEQATLERGYNLARFDGTGFTNIFPNAPGSRQVLRMSLDIDGSLWASFFSFYVGKLTPEGIWVNYNSTIPASDSLSNQFTNLALLADSQGQKWFCTLADPLLSQTLDQLDDKLDDDYANDEWTHHAIRSGGGDGLNSLSLQRAREDPAGNRWFLSTDDEIADGWIGIHILSADGSEWLEVSPRTESRMIADDVIDVAFEGGATYIALRDSGIQRWIHGGYDWSTLTDFASHQWRTPVVIPEHIPSAHAILCLALRSDGVLWIGTAGGVYKMFLFPPLSYISDFKGFNTGLLSPQVNDLALDREENLWVATALGLNRVARDDDTDIDAYSTAAAYQAVLSKLRYPLDVISPLSHESCLSLAADPDRDVLYVGTRAGVTIVDYTTPPLQPTDLSRVYVYPNPIYTSRGHEGLKIENLDGPVFVEIFTLEGDLVHTQDVSANGEIIWDLSTQKGFVASSGVYFARISGAEGSVVKPFSLIR